MKTQSNFKTLIGTMRIPFLALPVLIVFMVGNLAVYQGYVVSIPLFFMVLFAAITAHIAVNMLNEFEDFESGLDAITDKTPFSGGSGSLQQNPNMAAWVEKLAWFFIGTTIALGAFFIHIRGLWLLPLGLLGLVLVIAYTSNLTKRPWLCLISPGVAFGPIVVVGSFFVLTGDFSWNVLAVSFIPLFLVNNLLLLNQFPDELADRTIGRFNLIMLLGHEKAALVFKQFLIASYLVLLFLIIFQVLPLWTLITFLTLPIAFKLIQAITRYHNDLSNLKPVLGLNVVINLLTPLLIAVGLFLAS